MVWDLIKAVVADLVTELLNQARNLCSRSEQLCELSRQLFYILSRQKLAVCKRDVSYDLGLDQGGGC